MAALDTWVGLQAAIMTMDEAQCLELLKEEQEGKRRKMFLLRIHSRINRLRSASERTKLREMAEK